MTANRDGETALAGTTEGAIADNLGVRLHIRVGQDDDMIFRAALALHSLAPGGPFGVDVAGDRGRADEADGADLGVVEERIDGGF